MGLAHAHIAVAQVDADLLNRRVADAKAQRIGQIVLGIAEVLAIRIALPAAGLQVGQAQAAAPRGRARSTLRRESRGVVVSNGFFMGFILLLNQELLAHIPRGLGAYLVYKSQPGWENQRRLRSVKSLCDESVTFS